MLITEFSAQMCPQETSSNTQAEQAGVGTAGRLRKGLLEGTLKMWAVLGDLGLCPGLDTILRSRWQDGAP